MKSIRFKTLKILSYREKKARICDLDSDLVIINGDNGVGKSCLIKSIYRALGADIKNLADSWTEANTILLLHFTIDGVSYTSLRIGRDFYLFNPDKSLRFHEEVGSVFYTQKMNDLFETKLLTEDNKPENIPIGALCMPFYIDQDAGWHSPWTSFLRCGSMEQKAMYKQYLLGIVDDYYCHTKSKLVKILADIKKCNEKSSLYVELYRHVQNQFPDLKINISLDSFQKTEAKYLSSLNALQQRQHDKIDKLQKLYTKKSYLTMTLDQLQTNLREIKKDFKYALQESTVITCPICGGAYNNDMRARHDLLIDEHLCKDKIVATRQDLSSIEEQITKESQDNVDLINKISEVQAALRFSKNKITLEQVIDDRVRSRYIDYLQEIRDENYDQISLLQGQKRELESVLKNIDTNGRKEIVERDFAIVAQTVLKRMNYTSSHSELKLWGEVRATGSALPLQIIACSLAYLIIMDKYNAPIMMPMVIDEPRQQGLTTDSLNGIVDCLQEQAVKGRQLILSLAENRNIDNAKILNLNVGKRALIDADYINVKEEIECLLERTFMLNK